MTCSITVALLLLGFVHAQDVPPPPKPDAVDPALAPLLESLKQTLLASGRVEYSMTSISNQRTWHNWQEIDSVVVDAGGCQTRIHIKRMFFDHPETFTASLFFESIDTMEALAQQEAHDRDDSRVGRPRMYTYSGTVYSLVINGSESLIFGNDGQARKAANLVGHASEICRAAPITLNTATGQPGLADTLRFIEGKLSDNGPVNYISISADSDGSPNNKPTSWSEELLRVAADPSSCLLRFTKKSIMFDSPSDYQGVVSFRRVEKLEVATVQDERNRALARSGSTTRFKTEPVVFTLSVTYLGGTGLFINFRDEEMANRIAKAMNHAVELCGGGNKEPF